MKVLFKIIGIILLLLIFVSCSDARTKDSENINSTSKNSSKITSSNTLNKVGENVYIKEGESKKGNIIISSADIKGFYTEYDKSIKSNKFMFELTEEAKKSFAEKTKKLSQSSSKVSLWIKDDKIVTLSVYESITSGSFAIAYDDSINLCKKLQE